MDNLSRCKICGGQSRLVVVPADCSMHSGWATAECLANCGNKISLTPHDISTQGIVGMSTYESNSHYLRQAKQEVVRRWNLLNN